MLPKFFAMMVNKLGPTAGQDILPGMYMGEGLDISIALYGLI